MAKQRVGVLFGGCSGEHEVSIRSAQAIAAALSRGENQNKYEVVPVYILKTGHGNLAQKLQRCFNQDSLPMLALRPPQPFGDSRMLNRQWRLIFGFRCFTALMGKMAPFKDY